MELALEPQNTKLRVPFTVEKQVRTLATQDWYQSIGYVAPATAAIKVLFPYAIRLINPQIAINISECMGFPNWNGIIKGKCYFLSLLGVFKYEEYFPFRCQACYTEWSRKVDDARIFNLILVFLMSKGMFARTAQGTERLISPVLTSPAIPAS